MTAYFHTIKSILNFATGYIKSREKGYFHTIKSILNHTILKVHIGQCR
mgnify:CR=1 FL=1